MGEKYTVYKITNNKGEIYVGTTKKPLKFRLSQHISDATLRPQPSNKLHKSINSNGPKNHKITELDVAYNSADKKALETKWILNYDSVNNGLNSYLPSSLYKADPNIFYPILEYIQERYGIPLNKLVDEIKSELAIVPSDYKVKRPHAVVNENKKLMDDFYNLEKDQQTLEGF